MDVSEGVVAPMVARKRKNEETRKKSRVHAESYFNGLVACGREREILCGKAASVMFVGRGQRGKRGVWCSSHYGFFWVLLAFDNTEERRTPEESEEPRRETAAMSVTALIQTETTSDFI